MRPELTLESARGDGEVFLIEESTPDCLRMEWRRPQGLRIRPPADSHPTQREVIRILEGGLLAKVGTTERECQAGDYVEIPAGIEHRMLTDPAKPFRAELTFTPATGMLEFFEDLTRLQTMTNPVALARFAKRHRKAVRLATPFRQILDAIGVFIR